MLFRVTEASKLLRGPDSILAGPYVGMNVVSVWGRRWSCIEVFEAAWGRRGGGAAVAWGCIVAALLLRERGVGAARGV